MLLTQASRDLYQRAKDGWASLETWLDDPANASAVAPILASVSGLRKHWHDVDDGLLSDPDDVDGSFTDLQTAASYAKQQGYQPPAWFDASRPSTTELHPFTDAAQTVETWSSQRPVVDFVTDPGGKAPSTGVDKCVKAGVPKFLCTGDVADIPWWLWAAGVGGVAALFAGAYVAYTEADTIRSIAVALGGVPEGLSHRSPYRTPAHVNRAIEEELR